MKIDQTWTYQENKNFIEAMPDVARIGSNFSIKVADGRPDLIPESVFWGITVNGINNPTIVTLLSEISKEMNAMHSEITRLKKQLRREK